MKISGMAAVFAVAVFSGFAGAADWLQWRGPGRADTSLDTDLLQKWAAQGPSLRWTFSDTGVGYSGPAIAGDRLFIMGARGGTEYLIALNTSTGKEVWAAPVGPTFTFKGNSWGDGPRGTPSIEAGRVYALGGQGELLCADAATGKELWRVNLPKDLGGEISPLGGGPDKIGWGFCESPMLDGDHVICTPGGPAGMLAAVDKSTGKVVWRSTQLTDPATYSSIVLTEAGGKKQYVQMTDRGPAGVAANDGSLLWRYLRKPSYSDVVIPTPITRGDYVYTTAGTGAGCDLIKLRVEGGKFKAEKVYSNKYMVNMHGGVVLVGDYVYGYSDGKGWVCQDFYRGKLVWSEKRKLGRGSLTCADGELYCFGEDDGNVVLIKASPEGWKEQGRFHLPREAPRHSPNGKLWTHPVIANGHLYLRDQELLFCYDIKAGTQSRFLPVPRPKTSGSSAP